MQMRLSTQLVAFLECELAPFALEPAVYPWKWHSTWTPEPRYADRSGVEAGITAPCILGLAMFLLHSLR